MACRGVGLAALIVACGCSAGPNDATERNKALIRQFIQDVDRLPGLEAVDKWMTADFTMRVNGGQPIDLEAYRGAVTQMNKGFRT